MTAVQPSTSSIWFASAFCDAVQDGLRNLGTQDFMPVQRRCIPEFLARKDVIVQAPTGSGKTIAYVVPVIEILQRRSDTWKKWEIGALILVPTRELAVQVTAVLSAFTRVDSCPLRQETFIGGTKVEQDVARFKENGANIVVATPGRLAALLELPNFALAGHLRALEVLILDEADRLLELGFHTSFLTILERLPKQRRTGLFSATQATEAEELLKAGLRNAVRITVADTEHGRKRKLNEDAGPKLPDDGDNADHSKLPSSLENYFAIVPANAKFSFLVNFLAAHKTAKIVVFFSSCASVDYFDRLLHGVAGKRTGTVLALHRKKKHKRGSVFDQFRLHSGGAVLLCTDLMARGIDIPDIDWIVQFDLPRHATGFVHRCGRTARLGKSGCALLLLYDSESGYVEFLWRNQGVQMSHLQNADVYCKEEDTAKLLTKVRRMAARDRDVLERGSRAFVSFIEAYLKHDAQLVCPLKDLDVANAANGFGLLRLPRLREIARHDLSEFQRSDVDTSAVRYKDKNREKQRQHAITTRVSDELIVRKKATTAGIKHTNTAKNKRDASDKDWNDVELHDLDADYRLLKKLKRGKISKSQFDEQFGLD